MIIRLGKVIVMETRQCSLKINFHYFNRQHTISPKYTHRKNKTGVEMF